MLHYLGTLTFDVPFQFEAAAGIDFTRYQFVTPHRSLLLPTVAADSTPTTILTQDDQPTETLSDYIRHLGPPAFR